MDRAAVIRRSLRIFGWGIVGLLPFIGLIPSAVALTLWARTAGRYREWNPAEKYLDWGARLAALGLLLSILAVFAIAFSAINPT